MHDPKSDVPYGTLDLLILKTLETLGPLHGFGLARRIEQVSEHLVITLAELLEPVVALYQHMSLTLDRLVWFPSTSKARLLALAGEPGQELQQLQSTLAGELRRSGFSVEQRAWRPHLTLARYRGARKRFDPFQLPATQSIDLQLDRLSLFQSVAGPSGSAPQYLPLQHFELSP